MRSGLFGIFSAMKRAFAIFIVILLALGMIGLFFPALVGGLQPVSPQTPAQTAPPTNANVLPPATTTP